MSTKNRVLNILNEHRGDSVSGETLANTLDISRTAVWKAVNSLRKEGYVIHAVQNKGYCLSISGDVLNKNEIESYLNVKADVKVYGTVESTNKIALACAYDDPSPGSVFIANEQTGGKGRRGRSFISPPGTGLYMSFLLVPSFDISQGVLITTAASLAVARALKKICHVEPGIKWVNDVFVNGKKVCGILTEGAGDLETGEIKHIVVGIGVNCFDYDFPEEIKDVAGAVGGTFSRNRLAAQIINEMLVLSENLSDGKFIEDYKRLSMVIGKKIKVYKQDRVLPAKALDIDSKGGLKVKYEDGKTETLSTGEVTIRNEK